MATNEEITKIQKLLINSDVIELCKRERANTERRFNELANDTFSAAILKEVSMGCKDIVLPNPLLKNQAVKCLTFEENNRKLYTDSFCLFRALALHLNRHEN